VMAFIQEVESGNHPSIHSKFKASRGNITRPCLKKKKYKRQKFWGPSSGILRAFFSPVTKFSAHGHETIIKREDLQKGAAMCRAPVQSLPVDRLCIDVPGSSAQADVRHRSFHPGKGGKLGCATLGSTCNKSCSCSCPILPPLIVVPLLQQGLSHLL
jgi:hypothetical protein